MEKLKVAILEDNKILLKELNNLLKETGLVQVVQHALNSEDFFAGFNAANTDALILDIDLNGDSMNGIDIANQLKLPVLFASGKGKDYFDNIETFNLNTQLPVENISKPITLEKLQKILPKFIREINAFKNEKFVFIDLGVKKNTKIHVNEIVCICTDKEIGANSGNKRIYFSNRKPETLFNFAFTDIEKEGLSKQQFITTHKSFIVNSEHILSYNNREHNIELKVVNTSGKTEIMKVPVSDNYKKHIVKPLK